MLTVPQIEPVTASPMRPAGKLVRSVAGYTVLLSLMTITSLLIFAPAALLDCAWRNGRRAAAITLGIASAVMITIAVRQAQMPPVGPHDLALNLHAYLTPLLLIGVPALVVLPMVQHGADFGRVLMTATLIAFAGAGASEYITRAAANVSPNQVQYDATAQEYTQLIAEKEKTLQPDGLRLLRRIGDVTLYCFAAARMVFIILAFLFSLVLYGRLQAWRELMATRAPAVAAPYLFRRLVLPEWLLIVFVISGLAPLATGTLRQVGINVLAVVGFLYLLQGLAVLRAMLLTIGAGIFGVILAYGALLLFTPTGVAPLLLSIAGLFDSFFDFRHFNRKDSTHEGHSD